MENQINQTQSLPPKKDSFFSKRTNQVCIGCIVLFMILLIVSAITSKKEGKKESNKTETKSETVERMSPSDFYKKGLEEFEKEHWSNARSYFADVDKTDPNYEDAKKKMGICTDKIDAEYKKDSAERKKLDAKKEALEKKYEKLCNRGLYQYEIEQRLSSESFYMYDSQIEKAPDGSTQVKQYFSKNIDGFTVRITLQSAYGLGQYYCNVSVE